MHITAIARSHVYITSGGLTVIILTGKWIKLVATSHTNKVPPPQHHGDIWPTIPVLISRPVERAKYQVCRMTQILLTCNAVLSNKSDIEPCRNTRLLAWRQWCSIESNPIKLIFNDTNHEYISYTYRKTTVTNRSLATSPRDKLSSFHRVYMVVIFHLARTSRSD